MSSDLNFNSYEGNDNTKVLNDATSLGKKRDWTGKKKRSLLVAEHLFHASEDFAKKARRMVECANHMTFSVTSEGFLKLKQCFFCKGRLCAMCNWRRSLKVAFQNKKIVEECNRRHNYKWIFLTLTIRNCKGDELKKTIDKMMKAWNRFMGYKRIDEAVEGWFRALEVTRDGDEFITKKRYWKNPKLYDRQGLKIGDKNPNWKTYHPHYHVLICVKPSYLKGGRYIKKNDWRDMWAKAMRLDYNPIVDVRVVKPKKEVDFEEVEKVVMESISEQNAVFEVSKYPVKDTDILPADELTAEGIETVLCLENGLARKRLLGYGGVLKEIKRELKLDDAENGDLIHTGEDTTANAVGEVMAYWHIGLKEYVIHKEIVYHDGKKYDKATGEYLEDIE